MDLFSGSFGCFKPAGKDAKASLENDQKTEEKIKVWVLRCSKTGRVHYLEAYKDFVDVLLGFLMLRTGALIRLNREVSPAINEEKTSGGIYGVYDSFKRLDDSVVLVDRAILLDPHERLKVSEELQALDSGDFECCNADCFKYLSGSRQICRSCTISTHFSCVTCGGYFRENAHTSLCYTPWKPWRNHMTAAPILTRYTVIQSCPPTATKPEMAGYVRNNIPFIVTNELIITPLSTSNVSEVLKNCGAGSCDDLECNELSIGRAEVLVMLGAALTSPTPLTDIFGKMCNKKTRVSCSASGASYPQFASCAKTSTFDCNEDYCSSIKRSTSISSSKAGLPGGCVKTLKFQNKYESPIRGSPTTTSSLKFDICRKKSTSQDHDDSSMRRQTSSASSAFPDPCDKKSRPTDDRHDSSLKRQMSIIGHATMNHTDSPSSLGQCRRQFRQEVQEQRAVETQTECTPHRSSFRKKTAQKQTSRKITFQQERTANKEPEPQPTWFGYASPPESARAIASKSSFIGLSNFDKPSQCQSLLSLPQLPRNSSCTSSSSRSSTSLSQSLEQLPSPLPRPSMSKEQVPQHARTLRTRGPGLIRLIDDCAQVSSQNSPLGLGNSMSIINPLFQQDLFAVVNISPKPGTSIDGNLFLFRVDLKKPRASPSENMTFSNSIRIHPTSPLSRAPSVCLDESIVPCIARESQTVSNKQPTPTIVQRSFLPVQLPPGVTNISPAVRSSKKSAGIDFASKLRSVAAAFEQGAEPSRSNSGSISSNGSEFSGDSTTN